MVTSQKMIVREIDYRGSNSDNISEKEQRVDGHKCVKLTHLRYALMGFKRNYLIRIPSNHLKTLRPYTSLSTNQLCNLSDTLNP
jgi:hypothetical protein